MSSLPSGIITFLFTDIEGSTRLWERFPDAMRAASARHDTLVEDCVKRHRGRIVRPRGEGDSRFAVFALATDAAAAAASLQRALFEEEWHPNAALRVRIAMHTGEADFRDGDYYGEAVNRCARIRGLAWGGQTLVSRVTAELIRDGLPEETHLRDLGDYHLRDLDRPERIHELVPDGLFPEFPPLRGTSERPGRLPAKSNCFIDRDVLYREVRFLLLQHDVSLVTLTGPGGVGKSRLALQIGLDLLDRFPDGIFFIELASLSDPDRLLSAIGDGLNLREVEEQAIDDLVKAYLRGREILLILDNFEQIPDAAGAVAGLMEATPSLKLLVTSRVRLRLHAEREVAVPPLSLPDPRQLPPFDRLTQYEAIRLFVERAKAARADFVITPENAPAIAEICHRMDGLPLAIELAAARIRFLPPQAMLSRLTRRMKLLTAGKSDLPSRQRTLEATIDWSYRLLTEPERCLFRWLSAFSGGWTLEAAEAVCRCSKEETSEAGNDRRRRFDLLPAMETLVEQSMAWMEPDDASNPRYRMLDTLREFGLERLVEEGEAETARRLHARYYASWLDTQRVRLRGPEQSDATRRLECEHDNLRAALDACLRETGEPGDLETGLRIAGAMADFWHRRGYMSEGLAWTRRLLEASDGIEPTPVRAEALLAVGILSHYQDAVRAAQYLDEALSLYHRFGDEAGAAHAMIHRGTVASYVGDPHQSFLLLEDSVRRWRTLEDQWGLAMSLCALGRARGWYGPDADGCAYLEESVALFRKVGDAWGLGRALYHLGQLRLRRGETRPARDLLSEALQLVRETGDRYRIAYFLLPLGRIAVEGGDPHEAESFFRECLSLFCSLRHDRGLPLVFEGIARLALLQGHYERAVRLFGAASALRISFGARPKESGARPYEPEILEARKALGDLWYHQLWVEGSEMSKEDACEEAADL